MSADRELRAERERDLETVKRAAAKLDSYSEDAEKVDGHPGRRHLAERTAKAEAALRARMDDARQLQAQLRDEQLNGHPGHQPDVHRQLAMVSGALHGVEQRVAELVAKLGPVLDDDPERQHLLGNVGTRDRVATPDELEPTCELGRQLAELQHRCALVEELAGRAAGMVQL